MRVSIWARVVGVIALFIIFEKIGHHPDILVTEIFGTLAAVGGIGFVVWTVRQDNAYNRKLRDEPDPEPEPVYVDPAED